MSRTPAEAIPTDAAVGYVRDVLAQAAEPVEALRAARVAGPLIIWHFGDGGIRHSCFGRVGAVALDKEDCPSLERPWRWDVERAAWEQAGAEQPPAIEGWAETLTAADAALVEVLRGLGWMVVGVPTPHTEPAEEPEEERHCTTCDGKGWVHLEAINCPDCNDRGYGWGT